MGVELAGFQKQGNIYVLLLGKITADHYNYINLKPRLQNNCAKSIGAHKCINKHIIFSSKIKQNLLQIELIKTD